MQGASSEYDESRNVDQSRSGRGARFITTGERIGGFIGWAFVIAIALHAVLAPLFRIPGRPGGGSQAISTINQGQLATPHPPTPPPPTPTPPPQRAHERRTQNHQQIKNNLPPTHSKIGSHVPWVGRTTGPMQTGNPNPPATVSPGPAATVAACPAPNRDARTLTLVPPEYPPSLVDSGVGERQVQVAVTIAPDGAVVNEAVVSSSGYGLIDRDALRVARETTYAPRIRNCRPVLGTYKYVIDYQSG